MQMESMALRRLYQVELSCSECQYKNTTISLGKSKATSDKLPSRRKPITSSKVMPGSKQRSSSMEAVILKISKGAQKLKKVGDGKDISKKGC